MCTRSLTCCATSWQCNPLSFEAEPPCFTENVWQNSDHNKQHRPGSSDRPAVKDRSLNRKNKGESPSPFSPPFILGRFPLPAVCVPGRASHLRTPLFAVPSVRDENFLVRNLLCYWGPSPVYSQYSVLGWCHPLTPRSTRGHPFLLSQSSPTAACLLQETALSKHRSRPTWGLCTHLQLSTPSSRYHRKHHVMGGFFSVFCRCRKPQQT